MVERGLARLETDIEPLEAEMRLAARPAETKKEVEKIFGPGAELTGPLEPRAVPITQARRHFSLYDTYGLPRDFIEDAVRDAGLQVEWTAFDRAMEEQRTRARASWKGAHKDIANPVYGKLAETFRTEPDFYYETHRERSATSRPLSRRTARSMNLPAGAEGEIVLDRTVFYSESGGQVSDIGTLWNNEHYACTCRSARRVLSRLRTDRAPHRREGKARAWETASRATPTARAANTSSAITRRRT